MPEALLSTSLDTSLSGVRRLSEGKVRDIYQVEDDLLLVTTDRVSAFDVVLPEGIPEKGRVLNSLSAWWLDRTREIVDNHLITAEVEKYPAALRPARGLLEGRSMLVKRLRPIPFECVMRGFLYGSGWKEYRRDGSVCGISLPAGMQLAERFPEPLFTPATKAEDGHDENVSEAFVADALGKELTERLHRISREIYETGVAWARERGIIIADTKFEFGRDDEGRVYLIDEVLTPDSSRFWPADDYAPGRLQSSFDKQFVRDYLETLDWDKNPPAPHLPDEVVRGTTERFLGAYRRITGQPLPERYFFDD